MSLALTIPFELILAIGIGIDIVLAYFGFNVFKIVRRRLRARKARLATETGGSVAK